MILDSSDLNHVTGFVKIFLAYSLNCKNLLNSTWQPCEFQQPSPHYSGCPKSIHDFWIGLKWLSNGFYQRQLEPGLFTRSKNFKTPFFRDISNSFQWVTQTALKPHQNFFFEKILKTDAASPIFRFF